MRGHHAEATLALLVISSLPCSAGGMDPCAAPASAPTFGAEFIQDLPRPDRFKNPNQVEEIEVVSAGSKAIDAELEAERSLKCEALRAGIDDIDADRRLTTLEDLAHGILDLDDCGPAAAALWRSLGQERDPYLVYRTLDAISRQFEAPLLFAHRADLTGLIGHSSADVRRRAAELLRGLSLEPEQAHRVAAALHMEEDTWTKLALASLRLPGHEAAVAQVLVSMIHERGPAARAAMAVWSRSGESAVPLLDVLDRGGADRLAALFLLRERFQEGAVRRAFVRILREGSEDERLLAAYRLVEDPDVTIAADWLTVAFDPAIPAFRRASLVWFAGDHDAWRREACQAKQADVHIAALINSWVAHDQSERSGPGLPYRALERADSGTVLAVGAATVRCATRPFGPPRPGGQRLFGGAPFLVHDWFTQDGVPWVGTGGREGCWIPRDALNTAGPPETSGSPYSLEADLPVAALDSLETALAAGDLELFDPVDGFTGIRLRDATETMAKRWVSGDEGRRTVLVAVEANARLREGVRRQP